MTGAESKPNTFVSIANNVVRRLTTRGKEPEPADPDIVIKDILNATGFTELPSYWSGLPANREYFQGDTLLNVYTRIGKKAGEESAYSFAQMILDMPSLAPSNIVRATLSLSRNSYIYSSEFATEVLKGNSAIRPVQSGPYESIEDVAAEDFFGHVAASGLFADIADESDDIKTEFKRLLEEHGQLKKIIVTRTIIEPDK